MSLYRATVLRLVDGDTFDVEVDRRHRLQSRERVRLAGVAAPETRGSQRELGKLTKARVEELIPAGSAIALVDFGEKAEDAFRRWLCQVRFGTEFGRDLGTELIEDGWAVPYEDRKTFDWAGVEAWPLRRDEWNT